MIATPNPPRTLSIDPADPLLTLSELAALRTLPRRRGGTKLHTSTLARWATRGVRGVRLPSVVVGGSRCSTERALHAFFAELAEVRSVPGPSPAAAPAWDARREREVAGAVERVARRLGAG